MIRLCPVDLLHKARFLVHLVGAVDRLVAHLLACQVDPFAFDLAHDSTIFGEGAPLCLCLGECGHQAWQLIHKISAVNLLGTHLVLCQMLPNIILLPINILSLTDNASVNGEGASVCICLAECRHQGWKLLHS